MHACSLSGIMETPKWNRALTSVITCFIMLASKLLTYLGFFQLWKCAKPATLEGRTRLVVLCTLTGPAIIGQ